MDDRPSPPATARGDRTRRTDRLIRSSAKGAMDDSAGEEHSELSEVPDHTERATDQEANDRPEDDLQRAHDLHFRFPQMHVLNLGIPRTPMSGTGTYREQVGKTSVPLARKTSVTPCEGSDLTSAGCDVSPRGRGALGCTVWPCVAPDLGDVGLSSCYSGISVARVLTFRDHRIEYVMVQPQHNPKRLPTERDGEEFDHHVVLFPTRYASYIPTEMRADSDRSPAFGILPTADGGKVVWALR
jgi:hypothetical protein